MVIQKAVLSNVCTVCTKWNREAQLWDVKHIMSIQIQTTITQG